MLHGWLGPMLMKTRPDFVWGLIASMYIGNVMLLILNLPLIGIWVQFLKLPYKALMPLIITISAVGIYAIENNIFDLWIMLSFGIIGYLLRKSDFPLAPIVLAVMLAPLGNLFFEAIIDHVVRSFFHFFTYSSHLCCIHDLCSLFNVRSAV